LSVRVLLVHMSVSGGCELCATGEAAFGCDRCGKLVCDEHYNRDSGWCTECAAELRRPRDRVEQEEEGFNDGVDTYRM
jgi:hypothetical protein